MIPGMGDLVNSGSMPITGGGSSANSSRGNSTINLSKTFPAVAGSVNYWLLIGGVVVIAVVIYLVWKK